MFSLIPPFEFFNSDEQPKTPKALPSKTTPAKKPVEPRRERAMIDQISHKTERHYPNGLKEVFTTTHTRTLWER